jgi:hypothetical protein
VAADDADGVFCRSCGHHNPADANFCSSCGSALVPLGEDTTVTFHPVESAGEVGEEEMTVAVPDRKASRLGSVKAPAARSGGGDGCTWRLHRPSSVFLGVKRRVQGTSIRKETGL